MERVVTDTITGRRAERAQLESVLDSVEDGAAGFALIGGLLGIGKSTLLAALATTAQQRGFRALVGRASEYELELPYGAVADALAAPLAEFDADRLRRMGVDRPEELGALDPSLGTPTAGGVGDRHLLHRAVRELLGGLAGGRPLLLALDDLQWSDDGTLELLGALARRPPDGRVMIAATHRPSDRLAPLVLAVTAQGAPCLELGPLTPAEAAELVRGRVPAPQLDAVLREAGGNPFFLDQLARVPGVHDEGEDNGRLPVPTGVAAAIGHELAALSPAARTLLSGAAATGEPFDLHLARVAADLDAAAAAAAVDETAGVGLIAPADGPTRFAFRHPLVRRAVYEATGPGWRLGAHARLRRELERHGADVALVAHHVEHSAAAGDGEAVTTLIAAAEHRGARAPASAAHWLGAALRLMPGTDPRRHELLERRGAALLAAGRLEDARAVLLEADADSVTLAEVDLWLGFDAEALKRLERAQASLPAGSHREHARILFQRMLVHEMNMRYDELAQLVDEAYATAEAAGDRILLAGMRAIRVESLTTTDVPQALALYGPLRDEIAAMSDEELAPWPIMLQSLAWAATHLERFDEGADLFARALRIARRLADARLSGELAASVADPHFRAGRAAEALALLEDAVERARTAPSPRILWWTLFVLGMTQGRLGDGPAAMETMAECERVAAPLPARPELTVWTQYGTGVALAANGRLQAGAERIAPLLGEPEAPTLQAPDRQWARAIVLGAAIERGDLDLARRWVADADAWARTSGLSGAEGWARRAHAEVAIAEGDLPAATEHALAAADAFERGGAALEAPRARMLAADQLLGQGDRHEAVALLLAAEEAFTELGSEPDAAHATRRLQRLGRRVRARAATDDAAGAMAELSPREREIAVLVAEGLTNPEIAAALYISVKTVETHVRNIFAKLRVDRRAAVGARVREAGG